MVQIIINHQKTGEFALLKTTGHAGSAPNGEDLVCAAVSGIVLGGINALKGKHYKLKYDERNGNIQLSNIGKMSEHDEIVIETIIAQLQAVARDNPKYVKISIE